MSFKLEDPLEPFDTVQVKYESIFNIWKNFDEFSKKAEDYYELDFRGLETKKIEKQVKKFAEFCEDYRKSPNPVMQTLISRVDEFVELLPLIGALGNKNLNQGHWENILGKFEEGFGLIEKGSFNLRELLQIGV